VSVSRLVARDDACPSRIVSYGLLSCEECRTIAALYPDESHFRSQVHMARHGFGKREYRYFTYPLPDLIGELPGEPPARRQPRPLRHAPHARNHLSRRNVTVRINPRPSP
jgi:hypothetical protein